MQVNIDVVFISFLEGSLNVGLIKRSHGPFEGALSLPGGYVLEEQDACLEDAVNRVLLKKVGFKAAYMEQLKSFGSNVRDPRGWSLSVAYMVLLSPDQASSVKTLEWTPISSLKKLPFDHNEILNAAVARLKAKAAYSCLPMFLIEEMFTLSQLKSLYEKITSQEVSIRTFSRKLMLLNLIEKVDNKKLCGAHRPAQLYKMSSKNTTLVFNTLLV